ncbi:hypothetical protein DWF00_07640 [Bosea caraganae]|uniref:N-acetyltransferase domain-containing protein n=1 Tax=Bosea caraganae TaxID=2763117 RepID=A0A370L144_9HYPH|nr:GNAT family N-acetyltransferase [Bosea caraganae]RDJ21083.1 hypothetical protein DWE98_22435 [Bosea caraganae]RDJ28582.1 hypothetical protein DWF00_07640 [Bosea caraganae]
MANLLALAAAASAPAAGDSSISISARNEHLDILIQSMLPGNDLVGVNAAKGLFDRVMGTAASQLLFDYRADDLFERKAIVVIAKVEERVVGTLHVHMDDKQQLWVRGAVVDPVYSGRQIASAMGAMGVVHAGCSGLRFTRATLAIRILADGTMNEPSRVSFARLGFVEGELGEARIDGSFRNRHLFASCERDVFGPFTRYGRMHAGPDVFARSVRFLEAWRQLRHPDALATIR